MTKQIFIVFIFFSLIVVGQNNKDNYKISIDKYLYSVFYIFTNKPQGTFIPGSEKTIIKFTPRTDSVTYFDAEGKSRTDTLTTNHFALDRVVDSLCFNGIDKFLNSEINIYHGDQKLKIDRISVKVLFPDGTFYNTNFQSNKLSYDTRTIRQVKENVDNSYIVIGAVWFYDKNGKRQQISDEVGWKLKNCH